jgi:hypothetical protein
MPKNDKEPLSDEQVEAIRWWIEHGAPADGSVNSFEPDEELLATLRGALIE